MQNTLNLGARLLLSQLFIMAGLSKLGGGYQATQGYMEAMGVPGMLLPLVIALELGGGLILLLGWQTRLIALALAGFSLLSGALFHFDPSDNMQMIMFSKNLAIAGGLLLLSAYGGGRLSLDLRLQNLAK
ncbi:DoxX family protein [Balneatrix alpica]|uniref:DoxX family protein n=1 Tax=Balneatrix alpica TaxID=75684 RepID=UPI0027391C6F|nr:DoxX family protein [Balneatrix alpica]